MFKEKDLTEIEGIMQVIPDAFSSQHDETLDLASVELYLKTLLAKRKQDFLESTLGHLSPKSIKMMLSVIDGSKSSNKFEPIADKDEPMNNKANVIQKRNNKANKSNQNLFENDSHLKKG